MNLFRSWYGRFLIICWLFIQLISMVGLLLRYLNRTTPTPDTWGFWGFQSIVAIIVSLVALPISWGARRNPIGWAMLVAALFGSLNGLSQEYVIYTVLTGGTGPFDGAIIAALGGWLWIPSYALSAIYLPLLFPTGRYLTERWRIVGWLGVVWIVAAAFVVIFLPGPIVMHPFVSNPFGLAFMESMRVTPVVLVNLMLLPGLLVMLLAAASLILRYRRATLKVRTQIKWIAYGAPLFPFAGILGQYQGWLANSLLLLSIILPLGAIGIALLRADFFDIDLLYNRTLVYAALTTCVVGLYAALVGGMGLLFQAQANWAVALIATGLVAVLFQPLRERLQRWVNHLLYGQRDEPFDVLANLGRQLENVIAPETVYPTIVETVSQTLKLPFVAVAIQQAGSMVVVASVGKSPHEMTIFPMNYRGKKVGELHVAAREAGEPFSENEKRLLRNIARQAANTVHTLQLTADLQHARQQIVASREEERRRLRRDLHDELGPALAAQLLKLGSARALLAEQPISAANLLAETEEDIVATLSDVRRIVYNLRPPTLDQWGLVGALRIYAESCQQRELGSDSQSVSIDVIVMDELLTLPAAVEVAAYHIGREAMTNVVRHASASQCCIEISWQSEGHASVLELKIADNGSGFDPATQQGVGLASMQERAAELGGTCTISSKLSEGTTLVASLPFTEHKEEGS